MKNAKTRKHPDSRSKSSPPCDSHIHRTGSEGNRIQTHVCVTKVSVSSPRRRQSDDRLVARGANQIKFLVDASSPPNWRRSFDCLLQAWERIAPQSDDWQRELAETINMQRRAVANRE